MKVHNVQRITIIFCALFFSTFGHDYLKAHHVNRAHIHHANRDHHLVSHLKNRAANDSQQQCDWQCIPETDDGDQNLQLLINGTIIAIYNVKEHVAFVVDVNAQIGAVFNGTSGGCVLINIKTNKGYDIPNGIWIVGKESFQQFFDKLTTLEIIWNQAQQNGGGASFDIDKIPDTALHHIAQVFQFLGVGIAATIRASLKATIVIFVKHTKQFIEIFGGITDGLGKLSVKLHGDLEWLLNTFNGIKLFISKLPGGLKYLHDQGIDLRWQIIFKSKSGIEAFVTILEQIGQQVNLAQIFKDILNNPIEILGFIVSLGGEVSTGINGFFKVLYEIAAVYTDKVSISTLIETIIRYSTSKSYDFTTIRGYVQRILVFIQAQIKKYNTDDEWSSLQSFLQKLLDPKSVAIGGISISELLRAIGGVGNQSSIKTIINILWSIRVSIKIQQTIPQLVLVILQKLNSQIGLQILIKLVPDLQLKYSSTGEIDVVGTIKDQVKPQDLLPVLKDLPKLLKRLPIVGKIIKLIEDELQQVSHGEYNFDDLIKCSGAAQIAAAIRKWLKDALNIEVDVGGSGGGNNGNQGGIGGIIGGIVGHGSNGNGNDDGKGGGVGGGSGENSNSNGKGGQSGENHGNGKGDGKGGQSGENQGNGKGGNSGENHGNGKGGGAGAFGGHISGGLPHRVIYGSHHNEQQGSAKVESKKHHQIKEKHHQVHH